MGNRYHDPGYKAYYGRRSRGGMRTFLMFIIIFLLAVLVVAVGVFFILQDGLVYEDGEVHLILPWDRDKPEPAETSSPDPSENPSESLFIMEESPEPTLRELAEETLQAVGVTQTGLLSGRADEQARTAGGNAVLVTMKNDDGTLNYVSSVPLAVSLGASGSDGAVNQALRELTEGELYTVAQVSCFRDGVLGSEEEYALLTNSGWRWKDFEGVRWSSAANQTVQEYLADICVELAQMGFDEIMLTNCGYPAEGAGQLGWIRKGVNYPVGELDSVVDAFLARLRTALEPYEVKLSVRTPGRYLEGVESAGSDTGLTTALLLEGFDHVWVPAEEVSTGLAYPSSGDRVKAEAILVPYGPSAGGEDEAWAIVNGT